MTSVPENLRLPAVPPKKDTSAWWERFAIVVSAIALIVSGIATFLSYQQTTLLKEQVNAGDRNRSYENLITFADSFCSTLSARPVPDFGAYDASTGVSYIVLLREELDPKIFGDEYRRELREGYAKLNSAFRISRLWALPPQKDTVDAAADAFREVFFPVANLYNGAEFNDSFARQFGVANAACAYDSDKNLQTTIANWLSTGNWSPSFRASFSPGSQNVVLLLSKAERESMTDEQVIERGKSSEN